MTWEQHVSLLGELVLSWGPRDKAPYTLLAFLLPDDPDLSHTSPPVSPRLTSCFSMSSSRGELTKIVLCIKPTKHQKVSDSSSTSARMGATRSDMPWE